MRPSTAPRALPHLTGVGGSLFLSRWSSRWRLGSLARAADRLPPLFTLVQTPEAMSYWKLIADLAHSGILPPAPRIIRGGRTGTCARETRSHRPYRTHPPCLWGRHGHLVGSRGS